MTTDPLPLDLLVTGQVFVDIVFTGLPETPRPGTEVWASGMGSAPGGIANLAVAAARLDLRTGLAAAFGDDAYADWLWTVLGEQEGVDLSAARRYRHWHSAVTVSVALDGDRSMITHGHADPEPAAVLAAAAPPARAVVVDVLAGHDPWWRRRAGDGALVVADGGWDTTGRWDPARLAAALEGCAVFTPNADEAMAWTRTDTPAAAARALAQRVPLAVVTMGSEGALAVDSATGSEVRVEPLAVSAVDPTGAGDVFTAALVTATLHGWELTERLRFAVLCSALAVQHFGGSLAAPGWGDLADWWSATVGAAHTGDRDARATAEQYEFLGEALRGHRLNRVRRADATLARFSDATSPASLAVPRVREG